MEIKKRVAEAAVEYVQDGMVVGLGTGSTAYWAIQKLGARVKEGLRIKAIATSAKSEALAIELGIPMVPFAEVDYIDVTIDGADEVDMEFNLIKGGGGALLREKIVAAASRQLIVIVDETKLVRQLGQFPLPVEAVRFGIETTKRAIEQLGCRAGLRLHDGSPYITDNGNYILDCEFGTIEHPEQLTHRLNAIPGVVDNGLFIQMARKIIVGYRDGVIKTLE